MFDGRLIIMYCSVLMLIVVLEIPLVNGIQHEIKCGNNQKLVKLADREKCILKVVSKCISFRFKSLKGKVNAPYLAQEFNKNQLVTSDENGQNTMVTESSTNGLEGGSSGQTGTQDNVLVGENQYLLAYYAFECDVNDTSGNERHGRSNGTDLTYTTGISGLAANFTGSQSIAVDMFSNFDFGSEFTVSLWYKHLEGGDDRQFILNNGFRDNGEFEIKLGRFIFFASLFTQNESNFKYDPGVQFGVWRHVVLTYNGSYTALYINAEMRSGQSDCCSGPIPINPNPVVI